MQTEDRSTLRDGLAVAAVAALVRGAVLVGVLGEAMPAADGIYYHRLASRMAEGAGYTWLWPDGVVTYAAHYPVGYPFLLSLVYRITGPQAAAGALLNLLLGVAGVAAVQAMTRRFAGRRAGLLAGLLAALDPATVLYTPALMTEGVTASLLAVAAWLVGVASTEEHRRKAWWIAAAAVLGLLVLIRPQCLLLIPLFGLLSPPSARPGEGGRGGEVPPATAGGSPPSSLQGEGGRGGEVPPATAGGSPPSSLQGEGGRGGEVRALLLTLGALLVCLPWTARNCVRMDRCTLVSANGGWNLLIGAGPKATGHWAPVDVPAECREVFPEVAKDVCFGQAARRIIREAPGRWLALIPAKLGATFDYCGAGPWYLHEAAPGVFPFERKVQAGALETVVRRLMLIGALVALARGQGRGGGLLGGVGVALALTRGGWVAYVVLAALAGVRWARERGFFPAGALAGALGTTLLVHAIFFGAGRYGLVVSPLIAACAGALLTKTGPRRDTAAHAPD